MSIRNFNYGRNRRGRISLAAERFLYGSLAISLIAQFTFLIRKDDISIYVAAIFGAIYSLSHSFLAYGPRYFWGYLSAGLFGSILIDSVAIHTEWPFGKFQYLHLGPTIFSVPLLVPVFWLAVIHPLLILARRVAPNWVMASGALAITSYVIFTDQFLVSAGHKKWTFTGAHIPFQTHIPFTNLVGWLFTGFIGFGLLNVLLPKDRRKVSASLTSIDLLLVWTWFYNVIGNAFIFHRPGTALVGGIAFGALLLPYLANRYLGQP